MSKAFTLGVDIGGTNLRMGLVDDKGKIISFARKPSSELSKGNVVENLLAEIQLHLKENRFSEKPSAVAIGLPALMSRDKKTVLSSPNLKGFDGVCFGDELSARLGCPVFVDRDVNFLLQCDLAKLSLTNSHSVLGFYIGTGFGNAIYLNGNFYSGSNGAAGELGHIPILDSNERCTCGNIGCIETRCSGKSLEELTALHFPETDIKKVFKMHGNSPIIKAFVRNLAVPIATEINILDPEVCVIGGGVTDMEDFPKHELFDAIHFYARKPYPEKNLCLLFTRHDQQSGVFGSGIFAQKQIGNEVKT